jgi:hypothetical protein
MDYQLITMLHKNIKTIKSMCIPCYMHTNQMVIDHDGMALAFGLNTSMCTTWIGSE